MRYEDLCAAPAATLTRIAAHLDVACTDARAQAAVERSSAAELRRLEAADPDAWVALRGTRRDEPFFGPAVPGTWRTALSAEAAGRIETAFAPVMRELGYLDGGTR